MTRNTLAAPRTSRVARPLPLVLLLLCGALSGLQGAERRPSGRVLTVRATAYSWREAGHRRWGTRNALGGSLCRPLEGLEHCAVDPRVIPLGSIIQVPGVGRRIATDTGGAIRGRDLDLHFHSLREMRAWGARRVAVRIVRWGWDERRRRA